MKFIKFCTTICAIFLLLCLISCKKGPKGDIGPRGFKGDTGAIYSAFKEVGELDLILINAFMKDNITPFGGSLAADTFNLRHQLDISGLTVDNNESTIRLSITSLDLLTNVDMRFVLNNTVKELADISKDKLKSSSINFKLTKEDKTNKYIWESRISNTYPNPATGYEIKELRFDSKTKKLVLDVNLVSIEGNSTVNKASGTLKATLLLEKIKQ